MVSPRILTTDCDLYRISPSAPKSCLVCVGNETITVSRQSYFISPLRPHPQDRILYHVAQDGLKLITSFELLIFLSLSAECWELQVCPLACFIYLFRDQMVPCQYPTYWETRMSQPPPAHTRHHHPEGRKGEESPIYRSRVCTGNSGTGQEGGSWCHRDIWAVLEGSTPPPPTDSPLGWL